MSKRLSLSRIEGKSIIVYLIITLIICSESYSQIVGDPAVFDPSISVVRYDDENPPTRPPFGELVNWVATSRLNWSTESYKAYFYNIPFRLKFPNSYDPNSLEKYPMIIMLHGRGEKGTIYDNEWSMKHGGRQHRDAVDNGSFNGFVLYPQSESGFWGDSQFSTINELLVDHLSEEIHLDMNRIVVHGLSAGGQGTWNFISNYPLLFSGAVPMAAASPNYYAGIDNFKFIPVWFSTGGRDNAPTPFTAQALYNEILDRGGNIKYTLYENLGHGVWNTHYNEPDFFPFISRSNKVNPWALYGRNEFCPGETVDATLGVTPGFDDYEWRKDGVVISGANTNTIQVSEFGVYDVRIKRGDEWTYWSPTPVEVKLKAATQTPPISLANDLTSKVLPSIDGASTVELALPEGFESYEWRNFDTDEVVGTERIFVAAPGNYVASVTELYGCSSNFSEPFKVVDASGTDAPDGVSNFVGFSPSQTEVKLYWNDNPFPSFNETGFEIYRSLISEASYELIGIVDTDVLEYTDSDLSPNTTYYYKMRAINEYGASENSKEIGIITQTDTENPSSPLNLRITSTSKNSITLSWDEAVDNVGVSKYDVYRNGVKAAVTDATVATVYNLIEEETYNFTVRARDLSGNESVNSNQVTGTAVNSGLAYKYYEGTWNSLPDFNQLNPIKAGITDNIDIGVRDRNDKFGFLWEGYINIPVPGNYTFETRSDDGSKFYIGTYSYSATPVVNNDGLHGMRYREGTYNFPEAGSYPIAVTFFEKGGGQGMQLYWKNTAHGVTSRQLIPDNVFVDEVSLPDEAPLPPSNVTPNVASFSQIDITWEDNSDNETGFQIFRSTNVSGPFFSVQTVGPDQTSYQDIDLDASTTYYYQVNAIGQYGESEKVDAITSATTLELPSPPADPSNLLATAISDTEINLTWEDNSNNENDFVIYRSVNDDQNYRVIASVTENTFSDNGLFVNVTYYYKVTARGVGGESSFSNTSFVKTLNNLPQFSPINDAAVRTGTTTEISIDASDIDNELLSFSSDNLPSFISLVDNNDGTGKLVISPLSEDEGIYEITINVSDENDGISSQSFNLNVSENHVPVISTVSPLTIEEGNTQSIVITAQDEDTDDVLTWSTQALPEFISFTDNGDRTATIDINPFYTDAGDYTIEITVDDGNEGITTESINVQVLDVDPNTKVYVNFSHNSAAQAPWNNVNSVTSSTLLDSDQNDSGINIEIVNAPWKSYFLGATTGDNSGVYPDNVLKDYYYFGIFGAPETVNISVNGLDSQKKYKFEFHAGSVFANVADNGTTVYTINNESVSLYTQNNSSNTVSISGVTPDSNGNVIINLSKANDGTPVGYINAMVIESQVDDGNVPAAPNNLTLEILNETSVRLNWNDIPFNETAFEIYRSESSNDGFSLINPELNNSNTTSFIDENISNDKAYFYKVRAVNENGASAFTDVSSIFIPNAAPILEAIGDVTAIVDEVTQVNITARDGLENNVSIVVTGLPAFASFVDNGNGNGVITISPDNSQLGTFENITVRVEDSKGLFDTESISIITTPPILSSVFVNFSLNSQSTSPWNNSNQNPTEGELFSDLTDDNGDLTGIGIDLPGTWGGLFNKGATTGDNSGIVPDNVLQEYYWFGTLGAPEATSMTITGLIPYNKYSFKFIGSSTFSGNGIDDNGYTNYTINSATTSLYVQDNTSEVAEIKNISPNANGEITIDLTKGVGAAAGYINGLIIDIFDGSNIITPPTFLTAVGISKSSVQLNWFDNSGTEVGYEIYRAESENGNFTLLTTTAPDTDNYIDNGLQASKGYYYKIKTKYQDTSSDFSEVVRGATLYNSVFINLNGDPFYNAPIPWNNVSILPNDGDVLIGFKDDEDATTGLRMKWEETFDGNNDWGMTTNDNSGVYSDNVLKSFFFMDAPNYSRVILEGLDQSMEYSLIFFSSIEMDFSVRTKFTVGDKSVVNEGQNNVSNVSSISNIIPDINNSVAIEITNDENSRWSIWNSLVVQASPRGDLGNSRVYFKSPEFTYQGENIIDISKLANEFEMEVYPNPVTSALNFRYTNFKSDIFTINITDVTGKTVYSTEKYTTDISGIFDIDLSRENISNGLYFVSIVDLSGKALKVFKIAKK